jgi:uncharacterized protein involved in exopolysaccharide biosynthesis
MSDPRGSLFLRRLTTLVRWRRLIIANTLIVAMAAVIVSLLLPKWYRASASVFPPTEDTLNLGTVAAALAANVLSAPRPGTALFSSPSDLYATVLKSRSVKEPIIRRYDLMKDFKVRTMDEALETMRTRMKVRVGADGVVTLSVVDRDPERAARMANDFISILDEKVRERRRSSAGAVREFLERRVAGTRDSLRLAEATLQRIQEETGILVPEEQAKSLVENAVQIELGRRMREVQLGILRAQVGADDPERARLAREIALLEAQLSELERGGSGDSASFRVPLAELPARAVAYGRALRDLKIQEGLYEILMEQHEQYRIQELRDTPTIQVLDRAVPPEKRWRPIRWLICSIATLLAFLASCLLALAFDGFARWQDEDPERARHLDRLLGRLHPRRWFSSDGDPSSL